MMMDDVLEAAKTIQRHAATNHHITVRLSLLEDLIAEIERLQAEKEGRQNRPFDPQMTEDQQASVKSIVMKHTGIKSG